MVRARNNGSMSNAKTAQHTQHRVLYHTTMSESSDISAMQPVNPKPFLKGLVNHRVGVKLKFNSTEYRGTLVSTDNYFNLQLNEAEEFVAGVSHGTLGEIFIRCNNVLYIRELPN